MPRRGKLSVKFTVQRRIRVQRTVEVRRTIQPVAYGAIDSTGETGAVRCESCGGWTALPYDGFDGFLECRNCNEVLPLGSG